MQHYASYAGQRTPERGRIALPKAGRRLKDAAFPLVVTGLIVLGVCYNAILASINGNFSALTIASSIVFELVILCLAMVAVLSRGIYPADRPCIVLFVSACIIALVLSMINNAFVVEALRNLMIISFFTMLGIRSDFKTVYLVTAVAVGVAFFFMMMELLDLDLYVRIFEPWSYYFNTRGLGDPAFNETGLFRNALGFEGRFSFGIFDAPRTSSIFMEITSFSNFTSVIVIYLLTLWRSFGWKFRLFCAAFVVIALISNNTRMASILAVMSLAGYHVYPKLPRWSVFLVPVIVLLLAAGSVMVLGPSTEDDFAGRIGLTMDFLSKVDVSALFGARALEAGQFPDSGYPYLIYTATIFGAVLFCWYVTAVLPFTFPEQRRCAFGLAFFVFLNLIVAGDAVFSMKVACPLWFLVGYMRAFDPRRQAQHLTSVSARIIAV